MVGWRRWLIDRRCLCEEESGLGRLPAGFWALCFSRIHSGSRWPPTNLGLGLLPPCCYVQEPILPLSTIADPMKKVPSHKSLWLVRYGHFGGKIANRHKLSFIVASPYELCFTSSWRRLAASILSYILNSKKLQEKVKGKKLVNCTFLYPFLNETIAIKWNGK